MYIPFPKESPQLCKLCYIIGYFARTGVNQHTSTEFYKSHFHKWAHENPTTRFMLNSNVVSKFQVLAENTLSEIGRREEKLQSNNMNGFKYEFRATILTTTSNIQKFVDFRHCQSLFINMDVPINERVPLTCLLPRQLKNISTYLATLPPST